MLLSSHMKRYCITVCIIACFAMALVGCGKKKNLEDMVLVHMGNKTMTLGQFNDRIDKLPSYYRTVVEKNKKRYLDEVIMEMLLYEEGVRKGFDRDKEVTDLVRQAKKKIVITKLISQEIEGKIKVDENDIRGYYDEHKDDFKTPEMYRASHILVGTEKEAQDIESELAKGGNFAQLAAAHSIDATSSRGGDVGYFKLGQIIPDFEKACLRLKVGETSGIIHSQFGYHIVRLTDKKEPSIEPYDKVRPLIEAELEKKNRAELFDNLVLDMKEKYGVKIDDDAYATLSPDTGKGVQGDEIKHNG